MKLGLRDLLFYIILRWFKFILILGCFLLIGQVYLGFRRRQYPFDDLLSLINLHYYLSFFKCLFLMLIKMTFHYQLYLSLNLIFNSSWIKPYFNQYHFLNYLPICSMLHFHSHLILDD